MEKKYILYHFGEYKIIRSISTQYLIVNTYKLCLLILKIKSSNFSFLKKLNLLNLITKLYNLKKKINSNNKDIKNMNIKTNKFIYPFNKLIKSIEIPPRNL